MTNTRRWPPGPWIEPVRVLPNQWDFKKDCVVCGEFKTVWYFRHDGPLGSSNANPLCETCGASAFQLQQMDRIVNG